MGTSRARRPSALVTAVLMTAALVAGCSTPSLGAVAGEGLGEVAGEVAGDTGPRPTRHREAPTILPTPPLRVIPHDPEPVGSREGGTLYLSRVDVQNRSAVSVRVPERMVEVVVRTPRDQLTCEVRSVSPREPPMLGPGRTRQIVVWSLCPTPDEPHQVVALVGLEAMLDEPA